jgi:hypothetical protein
MFALGYCPPLTYMSFIIVSHSRHLMTVTLALVAWLQVTNGMIDGVSRE